MSEQTAPAHEPTAFNEAPASWNVKYQLDGFECQLTLRAHTGAELMPRTITAIDWLLEHGAHPVNFKAAAPTNGNGAPAASAPAPAPKAAAPAAAVPEEYVAVSSIAHAVTDTGHHYVKVKGGKFSKFGVKAWKESLPPTAADFESWVIGQEYAPLDGMEFAVVAGSKVVRFTTNQ